MAEVLPRAPKVVMVWKNQIAAASGIRDIKKWRNEGRTHDVIDSKGPILGTHDLYENKRYISSRLDVMENKQVNIRLLN